MNTQPLKVSVWGDWACFTRPEFKVERVSYPVITPSAARGVLEAIFWKPEFTWRVRRIVVVNRGSLCSVRRNEVTGRASMSTAAIDINAARTQRHTMALRDVNYVIEADVELARGVQDSEAKYRDQFRRRVSRGQCFHRPYLGCREFAAMFSEPTGHEVPDATWSEDLGRVLLDIEYGPDGAAPRFFDCRIERGVVQVPDVAFNRKEVSCVPGATGC